MKERKLGLLGRKVGMTQIFKDSGECIGVSVIELGPCKVLARRTMERDGYNALMIGFGSIQAKKVAAPQVGSLRAIGGVESARRHIMELRVPAEVVASVQPGQDITVGDLKLEPGNIIDVMGVSKGKGFQGVMKRHHFGGFRATHGTHEYFRHGGSIGCRKWPGRVFKGRKMPGRMGGKRVTTQNIEVVAVRAEDNVLLVKGSVPGAKNGLLMVRPAIKMRD